jgi:hypothetical protein
VERGWRGGGEGVESEDTGKLLHSDRITYLEMTQINMQLLAQAILQISPVFEARPIELKSKTKLSLQTSISNS